MVRLLKNNKNVTLSVRDLVDARIEDLGIKTRNSETRILELCMHGTEIPELWNRNRTEND